jgi:HlyD family type I secretion membrane fusion protein
MSVPVPVSAPADALRPPVSSSDYKSVALAGYLVIAFGFGGMLTYGAFAHLDSAVSAHASVAVESRRQVLQHLEGGIVREILVREGDRVAQGQVLLRLDDTQARANLDLFQNQLNSSLALEARLLAERDRKSEIDFPKEISVYEARTPLAKAIEDQQVQFSQRRASFDSQVSILRSRETALQEEIEGLKREGQSAEQQLYFIDDELKGVRELTDKGLVPKTRRNALEREKARLDGVVGRNDIEAAKARNSINEIQLQINQLEQRMQEEVANSLQDVRPKIADLREKVRVAQDSMRRLDMTAPRAGLVQNVRVSTVGQVLRPGDAVLEIVPQNDQLVIEAQIQPVDADSVHPGMMAEVRFPSFHSRTTPMILGKVRTVSSDRLIDDMTRQPYFLAQISTEDTDLPPDLTSRLRAGMPAEVVFPTGERSILEYLLSPLKDAFRNTFREK